MIDIRQTTEYVGTVERLLFARLQLAVIPPNGYGLCDMVGNVREWCLDAYQSDYYGFSPPENPVAGESIEEVLSNYKTCKNSRVFRGGSWYSSSGLTAGYAIGCEIYQLSQLQVSGFAV